jgi:hypothetical protein
LKLVKNNKRKEVKRSEVDLENKFLVYAHFRRNDNSLFYIGSGTRFRVNKITNRNKDWNKVTNSSQWYSKILVDDLKKNEAREIESLLIEMNSINLVNKLQPIAYYSEINEIILNRVYYDETSPTFLRWKSKVKGSKVKVGDVSGTFKFSLGKPSRILINVESKLFSAHRLVYSLFNRENISELVIDHIDGNPFNNSIGNLRAITNSLNSRNSALYSSNKSGETGISIRDLKEGDHLSGRYFVTWSSLDGKQKSKSFSIRKHGAEIAFRLAKEYRNSKIDELNSNGAGYSDRHGK